MAYNDWSSQNKKKKFVHASAGEKSKKDLPFVKAHARKRKFRMASEK